jgi:FixJ family two-component response regulator
MSASARGGNAATTGKATVHVIDDDVSLRDALELLFPCVGLEVLTYASVREFLDASAYDAPGCIVLDVRLPGISGLDFQSRREGFGVHLPMVLMTGHGDVPMSVRAMKAGAVDFLAKPFRDQDMIDAVMAAIERDRQRRAADAGAAAIRDCYANLSPREKQVMTLVAAGKMNKQVAFDLGVSEITVKIHRGAVMQKMGAQTFADLVRMADTLAPPAHEASRNAA